MSTTWEVIRCRLPEGRVDLSRKIKELEEQLERLWQRVREGGIEGPRRGEHRSDALESDPSWRPSSENTGQRLPREESIDDLKAQLRRAEDELSVRNRDIERVREESTAALHRAKQDFDFNLSLVMNVRKDGHESRVNAKLEELRSERDAAYETANARNAEMVSVRAYADEHIADLLLQLEQSRSEFTVYQKKATAANDAAEQRLEERIAELEAIIEKKAQEMSILNNKKDEYLKQVTQLLYENKELVDKLTPTQGGASKASGSV